MISILKAIVAGDAEDLRHQTHAELSYALSRKKPKDLEGSLAEISEAIRLRDKQRDKGWKFYEFCRARCRVLLDENFQGNKSSDSATSALIEMDLRSAHDDSKNWNKWLGENDEVVRWMKLNT